MNDILFYLFFILYCLDMYFINKDICELRDKILDLKKEIANLKIENIEKR